MTAPLKIFGVKELQKKFESFPPKLQKKMLRSSMTKAGRVVATAAKARVPVLTGALRKSIKVAGLAGGRGAGLTARAGGKAAPIGKRVRATLPYAAIVELGSKRSKAKPYLEPSLKDNEARIRDFVRDDIARQMKEMGQGAK
jgi:HK97 gp10 family phage protein